MKKCSARAPGKLIISGEHAVVYGMPAIAVAINRYVTTTVSSRTPRSVLFNLGDLAYREFSTHDTLRKLKRRLKHSYQKFIAGDYHIRDVLHKPFELAQFALINACDHIGMSVKGLDVQTDSTLATGCGMGSSAALAVSMTAAVLGYFDMRLTETQFFELAKTAENLQHGHTKGLDVMTSYKGGAIYFHEGRYRAVEFPDLPFYLVNTGRPTVSTGEVVAAVRTRFAESDIWSSFQAVTQALLAGLEPTFCEEKLAAGLMKNQRLLEAIGVVPKTVCAFVRAVEQAGGTAKLCGAGSHVGEAAGLVLVLAKDIQKILPLIESFQYECLQVSIDQLGVRYD